MASKSSSTINIADCTGISLLCDVFAFAASPGLAQAAPAQVGVSLGTTLALGSSTPLTNALYLMEAGDHSSIGVGDIHQGQLGDCFLLAAVGELAVYEPAAISKMISVNANGTESVTLFETPRGTVPGFGATQFSSTSQMVTNSFAAGSVNNAATQDVSGSSKEIWVQVLEKAFAQANGGYAAISQGGSPLIALQQLTGHTASWESPVQATAASLTADVTAGDLIVMDTTSAANLPYGLIGNHAYMFEGLVNSNGVSSVRLGNPWGIDQPSLIPVTQLAHSGVVEVDLGHTR